MQGSTEVENDSEGSSDWISIESATSSNIALPAWAYVLTQIAFGDFRYTQNVSRAS